MVYHNTDMALNYNGKHGDLNDLRPSHSSYDCDEPSLPDSAQISALPVSTASDGTVAILIIIIMVSVSDVKFNHGVC